jgi:hypothetical protein
MAVPCSSLVPRIAAALASLPEMIFVMLAKDYMAITVDARAQVDDRSLIENCCTKEAKQPLDLGHPPQKTRRAVRVHVVFTLLMCALATAYRLAWEQEAMGVSRWAGCGGGTSSSIRPGIRSSCLPTSGMASFISRSSLCWWGLS